MKNSVVTYLSRNISLLCLFFLSFPYLAYAEQKPVKVLESSSSGRTLMITAGSRDGLKLREALLLRRGNKKLSAARIIRLFEERAAVYVVARYSREQPQLKKGSYNILYGIPLDVPQLPGQIAGQIPSEQIVDELDQNPLDEQFLVEEEAREHEPEIDDMDYNPETTVKPQFPQPNFRKDHNISLGIGLYRNTDLAATLNSTTGEEVNTTYNGFFIRYGYNFRTNIWLKKKHKVLTTLEMSIGVYNFPFTDTSIGKTTQVEVLPIGTYLRINYEFNRMFMAYPYVGYQHNIVSATNDFSVGSLEPLEGGTVAFGVGASLVVSKTIDLRFDFGNDGIFFGTIVKF